MGQRLRYLRSTFLGRTFEFKIEGENHIARFSDRQGKKLVIGVESFLAAVEIEPFRKGSEFFGWSQRFFLRLRGQEGDIYSNGSNLGLAELVTRAAISARGQGQRP